MDVATKTLRDAILNGEISPGERVNEATFTAQLNISRTTFREAMRQLEQAGLLVRDPFRGTFVREFSEEEVANLNNLRGVFESYAAEVMIENGTYHKEDLKPLYDLVDQMEGLDPWENASRTNELHIEFHRTMLNMAKNKLLMDVWDDLAQQFWMAMRISQLSKSTAETFAQAHRDFTDAITMGNLDHMRRVIREHVM